ncbi:MAG TPA: alpha/beta hydrolase, partial [Bacteroidia bacterium]|nr:alpha/beta hydrolase [Bacteroidia bacterium]
VGFFGASTGAASALTAAAKIGSGISAVVSRGGRPDLAGFALSRVSCPTLFIVGAFDETCIPLNEEAYSKLKCTKNMIVVPGAGHLFEEPGKLEEVAKLAAEWFENYL